MKHLTDAPRKWVSTELLKEEAKRFRNYLKDMHVYYETSDCGFGLIHFECRMTEMEIEDANAFIDTL